jgi:hypothetical protein
MEPKWDYPMNHPKNKEIKDCNVKCLEEGMDFAQFTGERLKEYY